MRLQIYMYEHICRFHPDQLHQSCERYTNKYIIWRKKVDVAITCRPTANDKILTFIDSEILLRCSF